MWKSTSVSGAPDNSSLSHFSAMTWLHWHRRAVRNRHRHAIEQVSRRWRGGRRGDSGRTRRKFDFHTGWYRISLHGLFKQYENPLSKSIAKKTASRVGVVYTKQIAPRHKVGNRSSVLLSPSLRMTIDVPNSEKQSDSPFAAWPKTPMKDAKALVAAWGSPGCSPSNFALARTFME